PRLQGRGTAPHRAGHRRRLRAGRGRSGCGRAARRAPGAWPAVVTPPPDLPPGAAHPGDDSDVHRPAPKPPRIGPEGEVQVFGADEQNRAEVDIDRWVDLARDVLIAEGVRGEAELSLLFVDEGTIAELN